MSDWYTNTYSAVARTALIARSTDETLSTAFAKPIADSVTRSTELIKQIEAAAGQRRGKGHDEGHRGRPRQSTRPPRSRS